MRNSLNYKYLLYPFGLMRTKEILKVNPTIIPTRVESSESIISVYSYSENQIEDEKNISIQQCVTYSKNTDQVKWINIDGINKKVIEALASEFNIHTLIVEDIQSVGQRPKVDEINNHLFCLLNMLYFNHENNSIESEQISILLGPHYVMSFQEDGHRDVFNLLRERLKLSTSKIRQSKADYLCYALIDMIVDHYFLVMDKLGDKIEVLEEEIIKRPNTRSLAKINQLRKELIVLKRNIAPVRELVNGLIKSESALINDTTNKYFKDVYDHVIQANDLVENYRDMMMTMQDLYINQVNLKMNEVMKVMTITTCLLAPANVVGGIFGMNFDRIPYLHNQYGFYIAVSIMLFIPIWMILIFKRRGWF